MQKSGIAIVTALMAIFFFIGTAVADGGKHHGKGHGKGKAHMEEGSGSSKTDKHAGGSEYKDGHKGEGSSGEKNSDHKGKKMGHDKKGGGSMKEGHTANAH